jgi:hypothetical protein
VERRGVLGNVLDPHMEGANRLLSTLNPPNTCGTNVATAISINRLNSRPNGAGGGAAAPWLSPNAPIFGGSPLVIIVTRPMVVFCEDKVDLPRLWACLPLV